MIVGHRNVNEKCEQWSWKVMVDGVFLFGQESHEISYSFRNYGYYFFINLIGGLYYQIQVGINVLRDGLHYLNNNRCFSSLFQESDNLWWDAFATEFFEDDATLTLTFCLEDGPKRYS